MTKENAVCENCGELESSKLGCDKCRKFKHTITDAKVIKKPEDLIPILKEGIQNQNGEL